MPKVLVVYNSRSGNAAQIVEIRALLEQRFAQPDWDLEIHDIVPGDDVAAICRAAGSDGAALVIAAGGDGTVVAVANGLVQTNVPLGILPLGTGNDLARALGVPLNRDAALALLLGKHEVLEIDALKVADRYYFSNVSVGISPGMMAGTTPDQKKRFGLLAYVWTMLTWSKILRLHRYTLTIDGRRLRLRASEILISNTTLLERPPYVFGPPETLADGQLEIYLVTARTVAEYLRLGWDVIRRPGQPSVRLQRHTVQNNVRIDAGWRRRLVQADGEIIGRTPVEVALVRHALHVIKPLSGQPAATSPDAVAAAVNQIRGFISGQPAESASEPEKTEVTT